MVEHHSGGDVGLCATCKFRPDFRHRSIEIEKAPIGQEMTSKSYPALGTGVDYGNGVSQPRVALGVAITRPQINDRCIFMSDAYGGPEFTPLREVDRELFVQRFPT